MLTATWDIGQRVYNVNSKVLAWGTIVRPGIIDGWWVVRRDDGLERSWCESDLWNGAIS